MKEALITVTIAAGVASSHATGAATNYPSKPIRMITMGEAGMPSQLIRQE